MRKTGLIGLFALLLLMMTVGSASAQAPGDPDSAEPGEIIRGIVAVDGATAYVGPDFAYAIVGQLQRNSSVEILGRRGDFIFRWDGRQWLEINYGGDKAWVYARLIRTSIPFNSIPPTGRPLPRNNNGRVPEIFDLSSNICDRWVGSFGQNGSVISQDNREITVTYPAMPGANVYSVITISPTGFRTAFDSETTTAVITIDRLPISAGTYTWRVAPYWTNEPRRFRWQQLCLLETGGTFTRLADPPRNLGG